MGVGWVGREGSDLLGLQGLEEFELCPKDTGEPRKDFQLREVLLRFHGERSLWAGGREEGNVVPRQVSSSVWSPALCVYRT